jgi:hypothetical protein
MTCAISISLILAAIAAVLASFASVERNLLKVIRFGKAIGRELIVSKKSAH